MCFTKEELEDIYRTYESHGILDTPVIYKILKEYTYCPLCNNLISNLDFQKHFDDHQD